MKTTEVPAIIAEAKAAGCENADQINGYLAGEVSKLRETGNALRDYLTAKAGPIDDIPDEVFGPFIEALKPYYSDLPV